MLKSMINEKVENIVSIDWFIRVIEESVYTFFIRYFMLAKMETHNKNCHLNNSFAFNVQN